VCEKEIYTNECTHSWIEGDRKIDGINGVIKLKGKGIGRSVLV